MKRGKKSFLLLIPLLVLITNCGYEKTPEPVEVSCQIIEFTCEKSNPSSCDSANGWIKVKPATASNYLYSINSGPFSNNPEFEPLGAGKYEVAVKDKNNCITKEEVILENSEGLSADFEIIHAGINSNEGAIIIKVSGGTPPYMYKLGSDKQQSDSVFSNLQAGEYNVQISDAFNCSYTENSIIVGSGITYSGDIQPILNTNCIFPECHGGQQQPDLRDFGQIKEYSPVIKMYTQMQMMPPNGTLEQEEIDKIATWVDEGSPQN